MVNIPQAREVGYVNPRSGRIAPSGATVNVGNAVANIGQSLVQTAYNLNDLKTSETQDQLKAKSNDVSTSITKFLDAEEQGFLKARDETTESGIGFTRQFMEGYQKRADDFAKNNFKGLSPDDQTRYLNTILANGNTFYGKANDYESKAKSAFYDRGVNGNLDKIRSRVQNNAAPFADLKKEGLAAIDAVDMPEPWKADRRAKWDADAAESKWRWKFKDNPKEALSQIKAPSGANEGRAYQRLISKGWTPVQAAGIVGNLAAESSLNTTARNAGDGVDGSDSIGIAQWNGTRATALKAFAAEKGTDWHDIDTQVDFIDHELRTSEKSAGENLARSTTAEDAAAAFVGYERPYGWRPDNAKAAMHWEKRRDAALRIAGEAPASEDPDLESIPFDRRETLANWGETELNQQQSRDRAASKDNFNLMIATSPENVSPQVILRDTSLDNGDKASLINSLNTAMEKSGNTNLFLAELAKGNVAINAFDPDQKKVADSAYEKLAGATDPEQRMALTKDFVGRTGYIPKQTAAEIRRGMISTDVAEMGATLKNTDTLSRIAPSAIPAMEGSELVRKNLAAFRHYAYDMGYTQDEAAKKVIALNDPDKVMQREAVMKSETIKAFVKGITPASVADIFDPGPLTAGPSLGDTPEQSEIAVGYSPESEAVIVSDYKAMLEESLVDAGGDTALATKMTNERFQKIYGASELTLAGSKSVTKFPPEKAYPADINGKHDYIKSQAVADLKGEGVNATEVYLQAFEQTERDIAANRPANYQVFYVQDGKLNLYPSPFTFDPSKKDVDALAGSKAAQKQNLSDQKIFDDIRTAREKATEEFKDYPEVFRSQKMREAEQGVRDNWADRESGVAPVEKKAAPAVDLNDMPAVDIMGNTF